MALALDYKRNGQKNDEADKRCNKRAALCVITDSRDYFHNGVSLAVLNKSNVADSDKLSVGIYLYLADALARLYRSYKLVGIKLCFVGYIGV